MDVWGVGCVLFEIISKMPLFPGSDELDQLHRIHNVMGTPSQKLLKKMLGYVSKLDFPPNYHNTDTNQSFINVRYKQ